MKSTIKFDLVTHGNGSNHPCIKVVLENTDDVRDKIAALFFEKLSHDSQWCAVKFDEANDQGRKTITIQPIPPAHFEITAKLLQERIADRTKAFGSTTQEPL